MMPETSQMRKLSLKMRMLPPHTTLMLLVEPLSYCTVIILFQILKQDFGCDMILKLRNPTRRSWKACPFGLVSGFQSSVRWRCDFTFGEECCLGFTKSPGVLSRLRHQNVKQVPSMDLRGEL